MKIDAERLRGFLDCMHDEADEREKHSAQIRAIVTATKEAGYDTKAVRKVFNRERMDEAERSKQDDLLETYEGALGGKGRALAAIRAGVPVGEAAEANGVHRATLARARHGDSRVAKQGANATVAKQPSIATAPAHDPETGELKEDAGQDDAPTASIVEGARQLAELYGRGKGAAGDSVREIGGQPSVVGPMDAQVHTPPQPEHHSTDASADEDAGLPDLSLSSAAPSATHTDFATGNSAHEGDDDVERRTRCVASDGLRGRGAGDSVRRDNRLGGEADAPRPEGAPLGLERQGHVAGAAEPRHEQQDDAALHLHADGGRDQRAGAVVVQPDGLAGDGLGSRDGVASEQEVARVAPPVASHRIEADQPAVVDAVAASSPRVASDEMPPIPNFLDARQRVNA